MGRIVKAKTMASAGSENRCADTDNAAAEVTEVLLLARKAADAERAAAQTSAVILARKMAERIVGHAVDVDASVMADIVRQALHASRPRGSAVVLRVHPEDLTALEANRPRWLDDSMEIRLVADATVGRYGCVVDTPAGRVDARLATQLEVLERVLATVR